MRAVGVASWPAVVADVAEPPRVGIDGELCGRFLGANLELLVGLLVELLEPVQIGVGCQHDPQRLGAVAQEVLLLLADLRGEQVPHTGGLPGAGTSLQGSLDATDIGRCSGQGQADELSPVRRLGLGGVDRVAAAGRGGLVDRASQPCRLGQDADRVGEDVVIGPLHALGGRPVRR